MHYFVLCLEAHQILMAQSQLFVAVLRESPTQAQEPKGIQRIEHA